MSEYREKYAKELEKHFPPEADQASDYQKYAKRMEKCYSSDQAMSGEPEDDPDTPEHWWHGCSKHYKRLEELSQELPDHKKDLWAAAVCVLMAGVKIMELYKKLAALAPSKPVQPWNGCFTGDCPHETDGECVEHLRSYVAEIEQENLRLREAEPVQSEPVAWEYRTRMNDETWGGWRRCEKSTYDRCTDKGLPTEQVRELFTHPAAEGEDNG